MEHNLPEDLYARLGVKPNVDSGAIEKAYREMRQRYHPDRNLTDTKQAHENFIAVKEAYDTLKDPLSRRQYDSARGMAQLDELLRTVKSGVDYDATFRKDYLEPFFDRTKKTNDDDFDVYFGKIRTKFFEDLNIKNFKIKDED